jgi:hypothetical protein
MAKRVRATALRGRSGKRVQGGGDGGRRAGLWGGQEGWQRQTRTSTVTAAGREATGLLAEPVHDPASKRAERADPAV